VLYAGAILTDIDTVTAVAAAGLALAVRGVNLALSTDRDAWIDCLVPLVEGLSRAM